MFVLTLCVLLLASLANAGQTATKLATEPTTTAKNQASLHEAVRLGDQSNVQQLLERGAIVDAQNRYGVRPLWIACLTGEHSIARELLRAGADANAKRRGGETPLMTAARTGDADIVQLLVEQDAEVNAKEANRQTALMWAAAAGNAEAASALIGAGADLEATSKQGFTALHFAARDGQADVVAVLLDAGAKIDAIAKPARGGGRSPRKGMSALLFAVESGHFELALDLVRRGADPNDARSGYAPLHAISWVRKANRGDNPSGDPEPRGSGAIGSLAFVRKLAEAGADVNQRVQDNPAGVNQLKHEGASPVLFAARTADLPLVRLLVELGADPLVPNAQGCTPLMACAGVGVQAVGEEAGTEPEVLETLAYLVGQGAEVNTVDDNLETPMHGAAYRNFPRVVSYLAEQGADPANWDHKNQSGWTPMRIALGYRPGSLKPHPPTQAALREAMRNTGE